MEVLIALTILSLAMSISYSIVNSSTTALSAARTSATATSILQSQIETLRIKDLSGLVDANTYCIDNTNTNTLSIKNSNNCIINSIYDVSIVRSRSNSTDPYTYKAKAQWYVGGKQYTADMVYVY